jgi:hypothetical protein
MFVDPMLLTPDATGRKKPEGGFILDEMSRKTSDTTGCAIDPVYRQNHTNTLNGEIGYE